MAYQEGNLELSLDGSLRQTITFATAFASLPPIVIPIIRYTGAGTPDLVVINVVSVTVSGFTIQASTLPASQSDYRINYVAGTQLTQYLTAAKAGAKLSDLVALDDTTLDGNDLVYVADTSANTSNKTTLDNLKAWLGSIKSLLKPSCKVVSTGSNVDISSAPAILDGVTLENGDRILLKDQTTAIQNGIYVFTAAGSTLTRAEDFDEDEDVVGGAIVYVTEGTTLADTTWVLISDEPEIDTDALVFTRYDVLNKANRDASDIDANNATLWTAILDEFTETEKGLVPAPNSAVGKLLRDTGWDDPDLGAYPNPPSSELVTVRPEGDKTFLFLKDGRLYVGNDAEPIQLVPVGIDVIYDSPDHPRVHMDVETTTPDGFVLSLVTGDSDTVGLNGLPIIQKAQQPAMGANPLYVTYGRVL